MKTLLAAAVLAASPIAISTAAPASAAQSTPGCVSLGEFSHLRAGQTRREVETNWAAKGRWDARKSNPGVDAYDYRSCNKNIRFRVAYARHTRVWVWIESAR